jgi:branched-chain amino acid transport system ATP-binding protein
VTGALLQIRNIHTYYGDAHILDGVSLDVPVGSCVGIVGRNGVGKTTLARSIIGFTPPVRGEVVFKGVDITALPSRRIVRSGMAIVPQGRRVFVSLTVEENLRVARGQGHAPAAKPWTLERVYALFPRLLERRRQMADTLSGGEQQMLAIGRALMTSPALLILDEPTEGLAPIIIEDIVKAFEALRRSGVSLLLLEQRVEIALRLADIAVLMTSRGAIAFSGPPAQFPAHDAITGEIPLL